MALVTLQTRWNSIRQEKSFVLQSCAEASAAMAAGPVSANAVVGLAQRIRAGIDQWIDPVLTSPTVLAAVSTVADDDLIGTPWVPGSLPALLGGLKSLAVAVIAECRGCVPRDGTGRILKDTWNADGSVSVLQMQPADTAALRSALDALVAAIPE